MNVRVSIALKITVDFVRDDKDVEQNDFAFVARDVAMYGIAQDDAIVLRNRQCLGRVDRVRRLAGRVALEPEFLREMVGDRMFERMRPTLNAVFPSILGRSHAARATVPT